MSTGLAWLQVTVPPSLMIIASFAPGTVPLRWTANGADDGAPHPARASTARAGPARAGRRSIPRTLAKGDERDTTGHAARPGHATRPRVLAQDGPREHDRDDHARLAH